MNSKILTATLFASLMIGPYAIALETNTDTSNPQTTSSTAQNKQQEGAILDAIMMIDKTEIAAADVVLKRKVHPSVKGFAQFMIKEHGKNLKETKKLSQKLGVKPVPSSTSNTIQEQGKQLLNELKPLEGEAFQKAYIDAMVKGHTEALGLIKNDMQTVQNPALEKLLQDTEKHVQEHLEKAKAIQEKLG